MSVSKRNTMLDSFRGMACLLVVFCHFPLDNDLGTYIVAVARAAVPFFLLISGYFSLRSSSDDNINYARKKLISTVKLLVIGIVICIFFNTMFCILKGQAPLKWLKAAFGYKAIIKLMVFNLSYWLSAVMYYLFMMVYVYLIYILLNKYKLIKKSYCLIPVLLAINILLGRLKLNWYYSGNFFLTGIPFFLLGNMIKEKNIRFKSVTHNVLAIFGGLIMTCIENYYFGHCYCYVGTIILATSVFVLCISCEDVKKENRLDEFGIKYSMLIFLLHCHVGNYVCLFFEKCGITLGNYKPFIVIISTIFISMPIVSLREILASKRSGSMNYRILTHG